MSNWLERHRSPPSVVSYTSNARLPVDARRAARCSRRSKGRADIADNYGAARIRGYVHPLITGQYTFSFASDDAGDLLLSTSDNPANATRIAYVAEWTDPRQWNKFGTQRSAGINLTAGQKYYVEVLHKEATGRRSLRRGMGRPGHPADGDRRQSDLALRCGTGDVVQSRGHEGRHRDGHCHFVPSGHQLRCHVQRELQ